MATQTPVGYYDVPLHGRYYQPTSLGRQFTGGNQAVVATALAAGLTATYTGGLVLYNPLASGVNVAINYAIFAFLLAQTNVSLIGLGVGYSANAPTGTLTVVPSSPGNPGSSTVAQAVLYSSASVTLPVAPYLSRPLAVVGTGATSGIAGESAAVDIGGAVILSPGGFACYTSSAAGTASSFVGNFVWEEIPVGAL